MMKETPLRSSQHAGLETDLERAYQALILDLTCLGEVEANLLFAEAEYKDAETFLLTHSDPKALGANAEQREARIHESLSKERQKVLQCQHERLQVRTNVEVSRLTVEFRKMQVRLLELEKGNEVRP